MREWLVSRWDGWRERVGTHEVVSLEKSVTPYLSQMTSGEMELLFEDADRGLRIYHTGLETRVVPGLPAREVATGREEVMIECKVEGASYHLIGGWDRINRMFRFVRMDRYMDKGYQRVGVRRDVVAFVMEILTDEHESTSSGYLGFQATIDDGE